jgi:hypothetical protein
MKAVWSLSAKSCKTGLHILSIHPVLAAANLILQKFLIYHLKICGGGIKYGNCSQPVNRFFLASVELWVAIPAGFALELHPLLTATSSATGAIFGGFVVLLLSKNLRVFLTRL